MEPQSLLRSFLLALTVFFCTIATGQTVSGARFKFEKQIHDFGTLKEGAPAMYEFVFTNTGNEPLIITNCQASCGCTVPTWPKEPIMPGKQGRILVSFDTKNKSGTFLKSIWISSNAKTQQDREEIQIKGNVVK